MGAARRRRQLRHRDPLRVRPAPGLDGAGRDVDVPVRREPRRCCRRFGDWAADAPDEASHAGGDQLRPARAVRATGAGRPAGRRAGRLLVRRPARGRGGARAAARRSARSSTCSGRCPTPPCRGCWTAGRRPGCATTSAADTSPTSATRSSRRCSSTAPGCRRRCRRSTCTRWAARSAGSAPATSSFSGRAAGYTYNLIGTWTDPAEDAIAHRRRPRSRRPPSHRCRWAAATSTSTPTPTERHDVRACGVAYGDEIYDRLARLKRAVRPGEPVPPQPERAGPRHEPVPDPVLGRRRQHPVGLQPRRPAGPAADTGCG